MGGGVQAMKRIPRIKFPNRRSKATGSSQPQQAGGDTMSRSEVPVAQSNLTVGGKASLQPKRTPVSEREIEAILLGGCF